jgi:hypothetical protein
MRWRRNWVKISHVKRGKDYYLRPEQAKSRSDWGWGDLNVGKFWWCGDTGQISKACDDGGVKIVESGAAVAKPLAARAGVVGSLGARVWLVAGRDEARHHLDPLHVKRGKPPGEEIERRHAGEGWRLWSGCGIGKSDQIRPNPTEGGEVRMSG